ncbi:MAG: methionyl-tRNA formyltransferase [Candidatus Kapabacteria bacterium]|nr:methionyl-tRNA formyltransferase [Candidatus Kapabacteria bacterium]
MKIVYMGTPEFAVPTLKKLAAEYTVSAVVTAPDKPKGRGKQVLPSEVKLAALELGLPVLQPESLKSAEFAEEIRRLAPDIIVVVAFRILPREVYSLARLASFNIHGSLLPKYRGAAPINWAIINGDKATGLTSFILQDKVDTGNIMLQTSAEIGDTQTFGELYEYLMAQAPQLACDTIEMIANGDYPNIAQDEAKATPAPKIFSNDCRIIWNMPAQSIKNVINGVSPAPGAWTMWNGERLKILRAKCVNTLGLSAGEYEITKKGFLVQCGSGAIAVLELQLPGKKRQDIASFLNGQRNESKGKMDQP